MDQKKTGVFLRTLRKEKGLTQEQLAEIFGVSNRAVSRWETGNNLPDLSILIELADYYDVDIRELIDGERKSETMTPELKDTLQKAAAYEEILKRKAEVSAGRAFQITFSACALAIMIQLYLYGQTSMIAGETVVLLTGGLTYLILLIKNGSWEAASKIRDTRRNHLLVSMGSSLVCSILFYRNLRLHAALTLASHTVFFHTALFFVGMTVLAYGVLRVLLALSKGNKKRNEDLS